MSDWYTRWSCYEWQLDDIVKPINSSSTATFVVGPLSCKIDILSEPRWPHPCRWRWPSSRSRGSRRGCYSWPRLLSNQSRTFPNTERRATCPNCEDCCRSPAWLWLTERCQETVEVLLQYTVRCTITAATYFLLFSRLVLSIFWNVNAVNSITCAV